ncbi:MAG: retropepsin-like aspartic protease [Candidatus Omnitrophota bacterium]|nr:retropepsin-like aspartic protease [Candidatus Omnitrophota bacterium]
MRFLVSLFLLCVSFKFSYADTLYLKNGRSIDGIIESDNGRTVRLVVGVNSSVSFLKTEIESIVKSPEQDYQALRQKWEKQKVAQEEKMAKLKLEEEALPNAVDFSHSQQGIAVNVTLNNKVNARMVLDTGASSIIITRKIAEDLKINLTKVEPDMKVQVADGRQISAKRIILESVEVQGVEVKNVEGAILLDDAGNLGFGDGLLGMSFLKRFNFKVDQREKKLILEKL